MRLIDADELLSIVRHMTVVDKSVMHRMLIQMPTVDAIPVVHGQWRNGKCDQCGGHAPFWSMATTYYTSDFCPHCGARMDGKGSGNETD